MHPLCQPGIKPLTSDMMNYSDEIVRSNESFVDCPLTITLLKFDVLFVGRLCHSTARLSWIFIMYFINFSGCLF